MGVFVTVTIYRLCVVFSFFFFFAAPDEVMPVEVPSLFPPADP
jgi:hypothetical protein